MREEDFMNEKIQKGVWQHYKGNFYEVFGIATHTETEEELVIYRSLYGNFEIWARPLKMFLEQIEFSGIKQPRFKFLEMRSAHEFHET